MKLQTVIATLAALAPMAVAAEELFNGKYPYCTECEGKFENDDGLWNYVDHTWCKVNEEKCQAVDTCEPVNGYKCCKDSSPTIYYVDEDGEWSYEDGEWCIVKASEELELDMEIEAGAWLDLMPRPDFDISKIEAFFYLKFEDISAKAFLEEYEIVSVVLNGKQIDNKKIYPDVYLGLRFESINYDRTNNNIKLTVKNKKTNIEYTKEFNTPLEYSS